MNKKSLADFDKLEKQLKARNTSHLGTSGFSSLHLQSRVSCQDILKANDQAQLKKNLSSIEDSAVYVYGKRVSLRMWKRLDFNGNNIVSLAEAGSCCFPKLGCVPFSGWQNGE